MTTTVRLEHLENKLVLVDAANLKMRPIYVDFTTGVNAYRRQFGGGKKQLIARAIGFKSKHQPLTVIDATAGLGRDAFVLASLGCKVIMIERSNIVAQLLQDGLDRARKIAELNSTMQNLQLLTGNAITMLDKLYCAQLQFAVLPSPRPDAGRPSPAKPVEGEENKKNLEYTQIMSAQGISLTDVVYLDPMFPEHTKSSLVKKEMRVLRDLVGDDLDSEQLLLAAQKVATKRVVVKRFRQDPPIANSKPDLTFNGKTNRFDVYLNNINTNSVKGGGIL